MANEVHVVNALNQYLFSRPGVSRTSVVEHFETDCVVGKIRSNGGSKFVAISEEVYCDWPDDTEAIRLRLEQSGLFEEVNALPPRGVLVITTSGQRILSSSEFFKS